MRKSHKWQEGSMMRKLDYARIRRGFKTQIIKHITWVKTKCVKHPVALVSCGVAVGG